MTKTETSSDWDLVISGHSSLLDLNFKEVWRYRDLLLLFVKRDFISFYKQTIFGPLWFFIQPIFTTITFTFIFGKLANISTDGIPPHLFYLVGITAWGYFSECLTKTSTVFSVNAGIFGKVYFPRLIMPLSIVMSNLVKFFIQLILLVFFMLYFYFQGADFKVTYGLLLFPILVVLMAFLGLGLGLIITAMTTKYRDLSFLVAFGVQLLMYATPIIYPLSAAPLAYKKYIELNPMTAIVEAFRFGFLGKGDFSAYSLGYSAVVTFIVFLLGVVIFNKTEKTFVDTI